jgi:hypothetical protein
VFNLLLNYGSLPRLLKNKQDLQNQAANCSDQPPLEDTVSLARFLVVLLRPFSINLWWYHIIFGNASFQPKDKKVMQPVYKKLYSSPNIMRMNKSRRMKKEGHVARIGRRGTHINFGRKTGR